MSSKRKWDQAAPDTTPPDSDYPAKASKTDEGKTASEAAAAAAAIAAKIAAQFSAGGGIAGSIQIGQKDPHDGDFTHDIDINDVRNRYMLTKGSTQSEVRVSSGVACPANPANRLTRTRARQSAQRVFGIQTDQRQRRKTPRYTFIFRLQAKKCCRWQLTRLTS
jgi:hypothetical protein